MNLSSDTFLPAPSHQRNPWIPRPGLMLSGAGQCTESIHAMTLMQGEDQKPALIALYESIHQGVYHQNPDIFEAHTLFPGAVLQIGLQLPLFDTADMLRLAHGEWDAEVRRMAQNYRQIALPILLRIGYEFDGAEWNGYEPEAYILAYRYISGVLAQENVLNVALVWDSHTVDTPNALDWYPGDDVVDWIGYNTLAPKFATENRMAALAREKNKPLMNGEASYAIGVQNMPFGDWAREYFASMHRDGASAYQYINWRWQVYPSAAEWATWADGRITDSKQLQADFCRAMQAGGDRMVYRDASYAQPLRLSVACGRGLTEDTPEVPWSPAHDHHTADPGVTYTVQGATAVYGNGWFPGWRVEGACVLRFTVGKPFEGFCLLRPRSDEAVYWCVNDETVSWEPGHGYMHIPVSGAGNIDVTIVDKQGKAIALSHVFLMEAGSLPAPESCFGANTLSWTPVPNAMLYHIYRDGTLWALTATCTYERAEIGHRWAIAAYHPQRGLGWAKEAVT